MKPWVLYIVKGGCLFISSIGASPGPHWFGTDVDVHHRSLFAVHRALPAMAERERQKHIAMKYIVHWMDLGVVTNWKNMYLTVSPMIITMTCRADWICSHIDCQIPCGIGVGVRSPISPKSPVCPGVDRWKHWWRDPLNSRSRSRWWHLHPYIKNDRGLNELLKDPRFEQTRRGLICSNRRSLMRSYPVFLHLKMTCILSLKRWIPIFYQTT